eukprot:10765700-Ditylum_brightwellii.AAC.1
MSWRRAWQKNERVILVPWKKILQGSNDADDESALDEQGRDWDDNNHCCTIDFHCLLNTGDETNAVAWEGLPPPAVKGL